MVSVLCPDCGQPLAIPPGARSGDLIDCPSCAGLSLRVRGQGQQWRADIAHTVSCPDCGRRIVLVEGSAAGDSVECCGRGHRLTYEYGAFALEADPGGCSDVG
jgi:uncharacterized Zn finger protein (UPF0148 family)